jgi:hypothetical protein
METLELKARSDKRKNPELANFRRITFEEAKNLCQNRRYPIIDKNGNWAEVKITSVKTWKRDPERLEVHCQYGLYEYFTLNENNYNEILISL